MIEFLRNWRRLDAVWTHAQSFSATLLLTPNAILDKIVYTLTNPVKDGLVRDYRKWPGFNTRPSDWQSGPRTARRPNVYFTNTPEEIAYSVCAPTQLGHSVEHAIATVELHIRNAQEQAAVELAAQRRSVMGVNAVLATNPLAAPTTPRPVGDLNPTLAAGGDHDALANAKIASSSFAPRTALRGKDSRRQLARRFRAERCSCAPASDKRAQRSTHLGA